MRIMKGTDDFGRQYKFDIDEVRKKLDKIRNNIDKAMKSLVEKSDTEHLNELNSLEDALKEIDILEKIYF